jgi:DNA primase
MKPEKLNMKTMPARLREKGDLWGEFWKRRQRLEESITQLSSQIAPKAK